MQPCLGSRECATWTLSPAAAQCVPAIAEVTKKTPDPLYLFPFSRRLQFAGSPNSEESSICESVAIARSIRATTCWWRYHTSTSRYVAKIGHATLEREEPDSF